MSTIDEVKQKIDILDVVGQYVKLSKAGRIFRGLCPFHSEKHGSFFVYPERQSWHCFGACGTGGDVFSFIMKKEDLDFTGALRLLARRAGVDLPTRAEVGTRSKEKERLKQINQDAARYFHEQLQKSRVAESARNYLTHRELTENTISAFQLGFSPDSWQGLKEYLGAKAYREEEMLKAGVLVKSEAGGTYDRFRGKLMFPIADDKGNIVGYGARVLDDSHPKYINSPQTELFDKSSILYGINLARDAIRTADMAVIVEGYMDVITAHQNGFHNVVAAMGTSLTEKQLRLIKRLSKNVLLALDADAAGEEAMKRCITLENVLGTEIKIVKIPAGKDPDDVIKESPAEWLNLVERAVPLLDFVFGIVTSSLDLSKARDKSLAADRLLPVLTGMADRLRQGHYIQKLATLLKVERRNLEAELTRRKPELYHRSSVPPGAGKSKASRQRVMANPIEEQCLIFLFKHPELRERSDDLLSEYFKGSENREIFTVWRQMPGQDIREELSPEIREYLDEISANVLPDDHVEQRYAGYVLRLREEYLRRREREREDIFAQEAESGGATAGRAKLEEQGMEISEELKKIFTQKDRRSVDSRR